MTPKNQLEENVERDSQRMEWLVCVREFMCKAKVSPFSNIVPFTMNNYLSFPQTAFALRRKHTHIVVAGGDGSDGGDDGIGVDVAISVSSLTRSNTPRQSAIQTNGKSLFKDFFMHIA